MDNKEQTKTTAVHVAKAFELIAQANHYMVGFTYRPSLEELELAKQILIARQAGALQQFQITELGLAIDMLEFEIKGNKFVKGEL